MRHDIIHRFLYTLAALGLALGAVSCGDEGSWSNLDPGTGQQPDAEKPAEVTLRLKVSVLGDTPQTRAYPGVPDGSFEDPATDFEKLHTLRVIIVDSLGKVEHNRMVNLDKDGNVINDNLEFRISVPWIKEENGVEHFGLAHKKIWLFGNEKAANDAVFDAMAGVKLTETGAALTPEQINEYRDKGGMALDLLGVGTTFCGAFDNVNGWGSVEAEPQTALQSAVLTRADGRPFIDNSGTEKQYIPMNEFFDVSITSDDLQKSEGGTIFRVTKDLFLTRSLVKFTFSAQFIDNYPDYGKMRITDIKVNSLAESGYLVPDNTTYDPGKYDDSAYDKEGRYITGFNVPENAGNTQYMFSPVNFQVLRTNPAVGADNLYDTFMYFPETKISDNEKFTVTLTTMSKTGDDAELEEVETTYGPVDLPHLPQLPRNTHVYVNFTFNNPGVIKCQVDVVPYTGVWLNPNFGIDRQ